VFILESVVNTSIGKLLLMHLWILEGNFSTDSQIIMNESFWCGKLMIGEGYIGAREGNIWEISTSSHVSSLNVQLPKYNIF
jgi:hypothetical protein